jgi:hypothetical protein
MLLIYSSVYDNSYPAVCCNINMLDCDRICFGGKTNDSLGDCCDPDLIDCDSICNGTKVMDLSIPSVCCESDNLDCAQFCDGTYHLLLPLTNLF